MSYEEMTLTELKNSAKELGIKGISGMKKNELVDLLNAVKGHQKAGRKEQEESRTIEKTQSDNAQSDNTADKQSVSELDSGKEANGILEVMPDGFGFIRCENYLPGDNDIYVSPAQIKKFNLKTGDIIIGNQKVKTEREKFAALLYIKTINGYSVEEAMSRKNFEDLTPIFPDERIKLENEHSKTVSMRIMDLLAPIGKGQRGMIVAPPKAGKTTLLKQIAVSISRKYRDMHLIVLLIDERPEEVTDIRETIEGPNVEVIYSTFDELPEHHKRVAEMVLERAKRLVEHKEDVVILLDSITRLARAYNLTVPPSGRTLTGGLDPAALHMPKKFFGAARNMREGGSLTVLATALVETGSKMDDVVFEEFKGTGNMELVLDRRLSERRIFPAIDIAKSGTRRDDLLLTPVEKEIVNAMSREFNGNRAEERIEEILKLFVRTKDNNEFIELMKRSLLRK
ncbi:MAG: transcription termination factor Rho [Lachnospiraceae bacterium]|nr:transcription termination factor Rho [Lachnospiraceae bacterium]